MTRVCDKCRKMEATCYNGTMNLCDDCLLNEYNRLTSENHQCTICGRFGLPTDIRLILYLNQWASVPAACIDCIKLVADKRLARKMNRELTHMQSFGRPECDT